MSAALGIAMLRNDLSCFATIGITVLLCNPFVISHWATVEMGRIGGTVRTMRGSGSNSDLQWYV